MGRRRGGLSACAVRAWLLGATLAAACAPREVPASLLGDWTPTDPRYQGRSLAISRATIGFGTGPVTGESYLIENVESERGRDGATLHVVHYRDHDGTGRSVRLLVLAGATPTLRFENHKELWVHGASASPRPGGG